MHSSGDAPRRPSRGARSTEVVVTGLGATTPLGGDVAQTWRALLAGESGTGVVDEPWAEKLPVRIAARLRCEPAVTLSDREVRRMDRSEQAALVAGREAWADAGAPEVEPERFAVVMGTGIGGLEAAIAMDRVIERRGAQLLTPYAVPMFMPNGAAGQLSIALGARAGAHAPVSACASGSEAIAYGLELLRSGRADIVVAGGTDACVGRLGLASFGRMGALSRNMERPDEASRPFDKARDGFVLGEGAGALVLETEEHARARGARTYARLAGAAVNSDAHDLTVPDRAGQVRALTSVMTDAGLTPADVVHVNAHATGTPLGDVLESEAIGEAIGQHPVLTAPKSCLGHLIGGAGAVEAIITVLTIREGLVPATRNLLDQADEVKHEVVTGEPYRMKVPAALSNSFGFGGHNAVLAFTEL